MTELLWALTALAGICIGYMAGRTERRLDDARSGNDMADPVNHPSHYTDGRIETADYIESGRYSWWLGNAIKYISRAGKKDPAKYGEDLEKAIWYLERAAAWERLGKKKRPRRISADVYIADKCLTGARAQALHLIEDAVCVPPHAATDIRVRRLFTSERLLEAAEVLKEGVTDGE